MKQQYLIKSAALIWLITILYFSLKPEVEIPISLRIEYIDKLLHIAAYGLATILALLAYKNVNQKVSVILLFGLGFFIEIMQLFVVNRHFELTDLLANLCGIVLSYYLFHYYHQRYHSNNKNSI
tara:strand:- start:1614 stop:1985 length:372 start_codon:yes stop_codon:yes gene_type:complete